MQDFNDYAGAIHIHSSYSFDGRIPVSEIIVAAEENELDFLMLTDHFSLGAKNDGMGGWNNGVLLVVGQEISPRFNHYLAFGIDETIEVNENDGVKPQMYIDAVRKRGGIGFIAHPDHEGTCKFHVKHFPWLEWDVTGYTGMGIWDFMTDWQGTLDSFPGRLLSYFFPAHVLKGPETNTLYRWDSLNKIQKIVGIGELDNHDTLIKICGVKIRVFPFKRAFKMIRTHLLLEEPLTRDDNKHDENAILNALKNGRAYIALEYFHKAKGFLFVIRDESKLATMGDDFVLRNKAELFVCTPAKGNIRIVKDGQVIKTGRGTKLKSTINERGIYRIEVCHKVLGRDRPWIFSNPIYVR